jgi:vacuolar-type H+-ATPase subunit E/Vma4
MNHETISKLMEIQYLKGRLDELYKGYVPNNSTTDNRIVDSRISKYEEKLKKIDETAYYLYYIERENVRFSKQKSKEKIKNLLEEVLPTVYNDTLKEKIENQLNTYK